jgi:myosin heavy subunit
VIPKLRGTFVIKHYAGPVAYTANGFCGPLYRNQYISFIYTFVVKHYEGPVAYTANGFFCDWSSI